jgi:hypothetical protein
MTSTATKRAIDPALTQMLNEAAQASKRTKAAATPAAKEEVKEQDARFAEIAANTFYKIMFDPNASPEEKRDAVAAALSFEGTKEANKERIAEFELFKEYLQHVREEMAQEIIKLTDTEAFSELKSVYDDFNTSLNDFNDKMKPLTDIVEAIYTLRTNGLTFDAFREIQEDKKRETELVQKRDEQQRKLSDLRNNITTLQSDISVLGEQKGFFGFGGVKQSAREEIARKQLALEEANRNLGDLTTEIQNTSLEVATHESKIGQYAKEKEKLRELLDISTEGHKQRQKDLVESAQYFVNQAKVRIGSVREHLGKMGDQVENLADANGNMSTVYAIMTDGIKKAEVNNQAIRAEFLPVEGKEEDMITKMTREQKQAQVEGHIAMLDTSAVDTSSTLADLTSQSIRIKTMKDANMAQINKARTMHSQGIAGVADRLSVVLQAVSSAALGESSAMAKDTLQRMTADTNAVAQKESIRIAMGVTEANDDLIKAIDDLGAYGEVVKTATGISRDGLTEMRQKLDELQNLAKGVRDDIRDSIAVNAEVGLGVRPKVVEQDNAKKPAPAASNPFASLKIG